VRNRLWAVVGFSIGLLGLNGYLLQQEEENYFRHMDVQKEEAEVLLSTNTDPLMDTYQTRSANREQDYRSWGLDEVQLVAAMKKTRGLEDLHGKRVQAWFSNPAEPEDLRDYICGDTGKKPRYWGLSLLVTEDASGQRRRVINPGKVQELEEQDWSLKAPINEVYRTVELNLERKDDATRMGVAALMAGEEDLALEGVKPFGSGLVGSWSWKGAAELSAGLDERVITYFALLHLVLEEAWSEQGFCRL
jgi:hypothetical protein